MVEMCVCNATVLLHLVVRSHQTRSILNVLIIEKVQKIPIPNNDDASIKIMEGGGAQGHL